MHEVGGCSGARKDGKKTWNSGVPSGSHDPTNVSPCFDMTAHPHSGHTTYDAQQRTQGDAPMCDGCTGGEQQSSLELRSERPQ